MRSMSARRTAMFTPSGTLAIFEDERRLPVVDMASVPQRWGRRWSSHAGQGCSHRHHRAARVVDRSIVEHRPARGLDPVALDATSSVKTMMEASVAASPVLSAMTCLTRLEEVAKRYRKPPMRESRPAASHRWNCCRRR
jgi:hypothetical protein